MNALLLMLVLSGAPPQKIDFNKDEVAGPAADFEALVGDWRVAELGEQRGLLVDGSKWRSGTPSVNLADQARRLYGERYAEFLDGVKSFAFFPLAVWKGNCASATVTLSVRFFANNGRIDQGAGIAFDVKPDGSYFGVRANALEDNLLFFKVVKGKRTIIDMVRGAAPSSKAWHTLTLEITGKDTVVKVDGEVRHRRTLDVAPTGKCGLWSKADSQVLFDDFTVTPAP